MFTQVSKMVLSVVLVAVALIAFPVAPYAPAAAQATEVVTVFSESQRFSINVPTDWHMSTADTLWGRTSNIAGETIHVTSQESAFAAPDHTNMQELRFTLTAEYFPTDLYTADFIFENITSTPYTIGEVAGYPAGIFNNSCDSRNELLVLSPTLPKTNFVCGEMLVIGENMLYVADYIFPGATSPVDSGIVAQMQDKVDLMLASFTIYPPTDTLNIESPSPRSPLVLDNGALELPIFPFWVAMPWVNPVNGINPNATIDLYAPRYYVIMPDNYDAVLSTMYDAYSNEAFTPISLTYPLIQISVHTYGSLFGGALVTVDDEMRLNAATTILQNYGTVDRQNVTPVQFGASRGLVFPMANVFGGNNNATAMVIDMNFSFYVMVIAAPTPQWESLNTLFVQPYLNQLVVNPPVFAEGEVPEGNQVGLRAPDFEIQTLDGQTVRLSDFRGKPVLLNFWATWCPPCRDEMPLFQQYYTAHNGEVVIFAIDVNEDAATVRNFTDSLGITFPVGLDTTGKVGNLYGIMAYPTTVMINADGIIVYNPNPEEEVNSLDDIETWFATTR